MIHLISKENILEFDKAVVGLQRALDKTTLSKTWDVESLYEAVYQKQAFVFHQEESQYSGAFIIIESPLVKSLYVFWGGKEPTNKTPIDLEELDAFLVASAKCFGCDHIIVEGRDGWHKVTAHLGYKKDSVICIKEVHNEFPKIQPTASTGG